MNTYPFPHIVADKQWADAQLDRAWAEFDIIPDHVWQKFRNEREVKNACTFETAKGYGAETCWELRQQMASPGMIDYIGRTFGIPDLEFDELGGGLHEIPIGGLLAVHRDFNFDRQRRYRRINLLLYLNENWQEEEGGALELLGDFGTVSILPEFNRDVIFECSEHSWHGHPKPIAGTRSRRSLAAYYFTRIPPEDAEPPHDTIFYTGAL